MRRFLIAAAMLAGLAACGEIFDIALDEAKKGDVESQAAVAGMYFHGWGVEKNETQAFFWYKKAADQGHVESLHLVGLLSARGVGTKKDAIRAYIYLTLAEERGYQDDSRVLEALIAEMSPQDIAEAKTALARLKASAL